MLTAPDLTIQSRERDPPPPERERNLLLALGRERDQLAQIGHNLSARFLITSLEGEGAVAGAHDHKLLLEA